MNDHMELIMHEKDSLLCAIAIGPDLPVDNDGFRRVMITAMDANPVEGISFPASAAEAIIAASPG
jgi:hypothetical protein